MRTTAWHGAALTAMALASGLALAEAPLCRLGHRQSPIDIVAPVRQKLPTLDFRYQAAPLKLANDGHTLRVRFANGSHLGIGKERFTLQQFHFHTPGGDRIAGEEFPMAAHLLHRGPSGQLLALVVLFKLGAENPTLAALWPRIPPHAEGDHTIAGATVNARQLLPENRAYYRYQGSLTASPCTEGVTWLVLKQPLELSAEQLKFWKERFGDNMRSTQPLQGRIVVEGY